MFTSGGIIINVILSVTISGFLYYHLTFPCHCDDEKNGKNAWQTSNENGKTSIEDFYSSVWCWGSSHTTRRCRFTNLCYRPESKDFVFFHGDKSALHGIPADRFNPALLDLSSVEDHNTQYFSYTEVPASAAQLFNIELIDGTALVFNRFKPDNLMHVFHDDLLPMFFTLQEICGTTNIKHSICAKTLQLVFSDDSPACHYYDLYNLFSERKPILLSERKPLSLLCLSNAYVGISKYTIWYQYGFRKPQGPTNMDAELISREICKFTKFIRHQLDIDEQITPTCVSCEGTAVLLSRTDTRIIINEVDLTTTISQLTKMKVIVLRLEDNSMREIISTISQAQLLVGMHGAMLVLSMFLPKNAAIIELFPYAINPAHYTPYKTLAMLPGLELLYFSWQNMDPNNTQTHPNYPPELGGIEHLPEDEQHRIVNSNKVEPHLCCDNPEWMYRIYQDTIVDIQSFSKLLDKVMHAKQATKEKLMFSTHDLKPARSLAPSEVMHLSCKRIRNFAFKIEWKPPWNVVYMNAKAVEYELWIQLKGGEEENGVQAFIVKDTHYLIHNVSADSEYLVWIRCHVNKSVGPFNVYPLYCT